MQIMDDDNVKLINEDNVSELRINRPGSLNALNPDVLQGIILALEKLVKNDKTKVLILNSEGDKAFVAGADITSMAHLGPRAIADYVELGQRALRAIELCSFPVIASIQGYALGGGLELALACDLIVASEQAKFGQPEVNLGIIPGFGGTQRLIHRCGIGTARRLTYTADIIDANEALRLGLIDRVVPHNEHYKESMKIAQTIASKAPVAIRKAKEVIRQSQDASLLSGLRMEVQAFLELFATVDREEGMQAFMQKREAKFLGK